MAGCHDDDPSHDHGFGAWLPGQFFELAERVTGGFDDLWRTIGECVAELARQRCHVKAPG
jgi:hypothetical protein